MRHLDFQSHTPASFLPLCILLGSPPVSSSPGLLCQGPRTPGLLSSQIPEPYIASSLLEILHFFPLRNCLAGAEGMLAARLAASDNDVQSQSPLALRTFYLPQLLGSQEPSSLSASPLLPLFPHLFPPRFTRALCPLLVPQKAPFVVEHLSCSA